MSDGDLVLILAIVVGLLFAAFKAGGSSAQEEMVRRLLGMKRAKNSWEVGEGSELMGMKWIPSHWVYDDGKQIRRVVCLEDEWRFEDGTKPEPTRSFLKEIKGHWETVNGTQVDPTRMKPIEFADALHKWASKVEKFLPLGIEGVKLGVQASQKGLSIRKYGALLEQAGPLIRNESELPGDKNRLRIELAQALLTPELSDEMRNSICLAFTHLEFFLKQSEFEGIGSLRRSLGEPEILDLVSRSKRGENISAELGILAKKITGDRGDEAVWHRVVKRYGERVYQAAVLKSIAAGESEPDMAMLIAKVDAEVDRQARQRPQT